MKDSQTGLGVLLHLVFGDNEHTIETLQRGLNQKIAALELKDDELRFTFADGYRMRLWDDGQSCCESRYMTTDDALADFVGSQLLGAEIRDAPDIGEECCHEVQFLLIKTSKGVFTMETHNEHNGYYGGFAVVADALEPAAPSEIVTTSGHSDKPA